MGHQKSPKLLDEFRHGTSQRERQKKRLRSFFSTQGICQWIRDLLSLRHILIQTWEAYFGLSQKLAINKNPQFLFNQADFHAILSTHELVIFTKFHKDWVKIVDFSIKAYSDNFINS